MALPIGLLVLLLIADGALALLMRASAARNLAAAPRHPADSAPTSPSAAFAVDAVRPSPRQGGHAPATKSPLSRLASALAIATMVAIASPSRSPIVNAAGRHAAPRPVFANDWLLTGGVAALALAVIGYSIASARTMVASARRRRELDADARKALHFVDEFEDTAAAAGSGKPIISAPCPMSRSSSPTTSSAAARNCSAASSPICCRSTPATAPARGAQDAGLPPLRPLPILRCRRPCRQRRGHPLVAVGQPDLRRAGPLHGLPRHRHRPHRAAPHRTGNHPAGALRLADRPAQPGDDAADARRGSAQRLAPAEGLRACS